jgi:hypothetical protein
MVQSELKRFARQTVRLDRLATNIRHETGTILNRAALIRGVIDALFDSQVDVNRVESERELRRLGTTTRPASDRSLLLADKLRG